MPKPLRLAPDRLPTQCIVHLPADRLTPDSTPPAVDAVFIDLGLCAPGESEAIRRQLVELIRRWRGATAPWPGIIVRIHPLTDIDSASADIAAAVAAGADCVMLPEARSGADVQQLDTLLSVEEVVCGNEQGETGIIAVSGDNAAGLLSAASFAGKSDRLLALAFDPGALRNAIGAQSGGSQAEGMARSLTLLAAAAAGVSAIEVADRDLHDAAFHQACAESRREGIDAIVTADSEQAGIVRSCYSTAGD